MTWRDRLFDDGIGSFRGVPFFVDSAESSIGRRKVVHEFPGRTDPRVVDDGGRARRFTLQCYVLGDDYDIDRDRLRREFTASGPGLLVHPYWGEFEVEVVSEVRIRESVGEGGVARFTLDMVEVGQEPLTTTAPDLGPQVEAAADAASDAVRDSFLDVFTSDGVIAQVLDSAADAVNDLASQLRSARGFINSALGVVDDLGTSIDLLAQGATALVQAPGDLVDSIQDLGAQVLSAVSQVEGALTEEISNFGRLFGDFQARKTLDGVRELTSDPGFEELVETDSVQKQIEIKNQEALGILQKRNTVVESARVLVTIEYESRDFVLSVRDEINTLFDELFLEADDNLWAALTDLKDVFSRRMVELAEALPNVTEFEANTVLPALVLAYNIHKNANRDLELVARNNIQDPNFVPGFETLRALTDG